MNARYLCSLIRALWLSWRVAKGEEEEEGKRE
jgi:hypothetical protein